MLRLTQILLSITTALLLCTSAVAQQTPQMPPTPPPDRYPWDQRPIKCFAPGTEPFGECRPVDDYPSSERSIGYIFNLYSNETYRQLERYLTNLVTSKKRFQDGVYPEEVIFRAFTRLMPMPAEDGTGLERNDAWRNAFPDSQFVVLAEFARLRATAWNARGSGRSDTVSKESWELFAIRLQEAEQVLLKAPQSLRNSALWDMGLLGVALDSRQVQSNPQRVFERAVQRWPTHAMFYEMMIGRMIPKWGGSWAEVESFITEWTAKQPDSEGKSLYARLYIHLISERSPYESEFRWDTMKVGFEDAIARFPDPKYKNLYASFACLAKDKALFSKMMGKMTRDELIPAWWLDGSSYDACVRWAGV